MRGAALIVLLGSALAVALAAWISGLLTRPLRQLSAAAARLARGEYDAPLPTAQNDEIGALIRAFSGMSGAIGEREAALRAQAEERQALIDALAHEMRTPLSNLMGQTQQALDRSGAGVEAGRRQNLVADRLPGGIGVEKKAAVRMCGKDQGAIGGGEQSLAMATIETKALPRTRRQAATGRRHHGCHRPISPAFRHKLTADHLGLREPRL